MAKDKAHYSAYSQTSKAEDFAETVMLYISSNGGQKLGSTERAKFGERFKVLDDLFKNNSSDQKWVKNQIKIALGTVIGASAMYAGEKGIAYMLSEDDKKEEVKSQNNQKTDKETEYPLVDDNSKPEEPKPEVKKTSKILDSLILKDDDKPEEPKPEKVIESLLLDEKDKQQTPKITVGYQSKKPLSRNNPK